MALCGSRSQTVCTVLFCADGVSLLAVSVQAVLKEVSDSNGKIVLFIDEIHTVVGAGATGGAMDAGEHRRAASSIREL